MSQGRLLQFVRETWGRENLARNTSIVKSLSQRYSEEEVEAMVRGAKMVGARDLRLIWAEEGEGRRNALTAYYRSQQKQKSPLPDRVKTILWKMVAP